MQNDKLPCYYCKLFFCWGFLSFFWRVHGSMVVHGPCPTSKPPQAHPQPQLRSTHTNLLARSGPWLLTSACRTLLHFFNALQTILTILKLSTDLHTEISHGPLYNVLQELQSLPRTSKTGLREKGDKYFIRLHWEMIDCPKACLYSHRSPNYISWSNERCSIFLQTLSSLHLWVSENNLRQFHQTGKRSACVNNWDFISQMWFNKCLLNKFKHHWMR